MREIIWHLNERIYCLENCLFKEIVLYTGSLPRQKKNRRNKSQNEKIKGNNIRALEIFLKSFGKELFED